MNVIKSKGGYFYKVYKNGKKIRISKNEYLKYQKISNKKRLSKKTMKGGRTINIHITDNKGNIRNDLVVLDTGVSYNPFGYSTKPDELRLEIGNYKNTKLIRDLTFMKELPNKKTDEVRVNKKTDEVRVNKIKYLLKNTLPVVVESMQTDEAFKKPWVKSVLEIEAQKLYDEYKKKEWLKITNNGYEMVEFKNYTYLKSTQDLLRTLGNYAFSDSANITGNNKNKLKIQITNELKQYIEDYNNNFNCGVTVEEGLDNNPLSLACKTNDEEIVDLVLEFNNIDEIFQLFDNHQNNIFHMLIFYDIELNMFDKILRFLKESDKKQLLQFLLKNPNFNSYTPLNILEELIKVKGHNLSKRYFKFKGEDTEIQFFGRELGYNSNISYIFDNQSITIDIRMLKFNEKYPKILEIRLKYRTSNSNIINNKNKELILKSLMKNIQKF